MHIALTIYNRAKQYLNQSTSIRASQETFISPFTIKLHYPLYIKTYILILGDVANIEFGAKIFTGERCYQNMTTLER
jgi:hypothetical protein